MGLICHETFSSIGYPHIIDFCVNTAQYNLIIYITQEWQNDFQPTKDAPSIHDDKNFHTNGRVLPNKTWITYKYINI